MVVSYPKMVDIESVLEQLNNSGRDVSRFGDGKCIVYAVPEVFQEYQLDIELLLNHIRDKENIDFCVILDEIVGMKACKASIKAGQRLSMGEMEQLMRDGVEHIAGMFVCQHGRPSVVKMRRGEVDGFFDR